VPRSTSRSARRAIRSTTGKQKLVDTAGRIERFNRKYGSAGKASKAGTAGEG